MLLLGREQPGCLCLLPHVRSSRLEGVARSEQWSKVLRRTLDKRRPASNVDAPHFIIADDDGNYYTYNCTIASE